MDRRGHPELLWHGGPAWRGTAAAEGTQLTVPNGWTTAADGLSFGHWLITLGRVVIRVVRRQRLPMPVSFLPLIFPALLIGVPLLFLAKGRKPFLRATAVSASIVLLLFLRVYVPGFLPSFSFPGPVFPPQPIQSRSHKPPTGPPPTGLDQLHA
jgi:hypothetical protein